MARMKRCLVPLLVVLLIPAAKANTVVYRCVGTHGETVFSGLPCDATAMAAEGDANAANDGQDTWLDNCASSANDLRDRVAAAFDSHDVNLLGGLFLWRGISNRNAYQHMRDLRELVRQPLAGLSLDGAPAWQAESNGYGALPDDANTWLSLAVGGDDNGASAQDPNVAQPTVEHQFALVERSACIWLTF